MASCTLKVNRIDEAVLQVIEEAGCDVDFFVQITGKPDDVRAAALGLRPFTERPQTKPRAEIVCETGLLRKRDEETGTKTQPIDKQLQEKISEERRDRQLEMKIHEDTETKAQAEGEETET